MTITEQFKKDGYVTNLNIFNEDEANNYRSKFDELESSLGKETSQAEVVGMHKKHAWLWEIATHKHILDAAEQLIGPDILLLGTAFFCKYPQFSESYIAWHQDITYWDIEPLEPQKVITVWLAIDDTDVDNGCMRVVPASHHHGILPHGKASQPGNLLSVNQAVGTEVFDETQAIDLNLKAGTASVHDGLLLHGSNPNRSTRRRCGLAIRLTVPSIKPVTKSGDKPKTWSPFLVRGEDHYGHFDLLSTPTFTCQPVNQGI